MKISTKLWLAVFVPVLLALVVMGALFFSYQEMRTIQQKGDTVRQIRTSITELNHIIFSYVLFHEDRPKEQFLAEQDTLTGLIASAHLQNSQQQKLLDNIREDSTTMKESFQQLVVNYDSSNPNNAVEIQSTEDRLTGSLLLRSYEADSNAAALRSLVDDGIRVSEIRTIGLILLVLILATIPLTIVLARTRKNIVSSLSTLVKGTAVVGSGNLDFQIEEKNKDEIGDLARAFNQMTTNLKTVTASKKDLETEIAERKRAEEALRQSEQRWATTLASIGDAVIATDMYGRVTFMNAVAENLTGWKISEASGKPTADIFNIINEKSREKVESPVNKVFKQGTICGLANHTVLIRKDGTEVAIDDSGAPIKTPDGQIIGVVLIFRDITERRQGEESLKHYTAELEAANKELESFSYSVSHDLRTPLRTLDGFSEVVLLDYGDKLDETGKGHLNRIRTASQTMSQLIDSILKLSRITRSEIYRENINLSDLAKSIINELQSAQPDRPSEVNIEPNLIVKGDKALLEILMRNLLENAWKYTSKSPESRIAVGSSVRDQKKVYFVQDNGIGFDMQYASKLFQPFQRLHSSKEYPGTGIGLATVQRVVRRHGGQIWAESKIGEGTTFYFTLE